MNKLVKIIFAILGAFNVLIDLMMPMAVALIWGYLFELSSLLDAVVLTIGGLSTIFRGLKIGGWIKKDE